MADSIDLDDLGEPVSHVSIDDSFINTSTMLSFTWDSISFYDLSTTPRFHLFGYDWDLFTGNSQQLGPGQFKYTLTCVPSPFMTIIKEPDSTLSGLINTLGVSFMQKLPRGGDAETDLGSLFSSDYTFPVPMYGQPFGTLLQYWRKQSWHSNLDSPGNLQWLYLSVFGVCSNTLDGLTGGDVVSLDADQSSKDLYDTLGTAYSQFTYINSKPLSIYKAERFPDHYLDSDIWSLLFRSHITIISAIGFIVGRMYKLTDAFFAMVGASDMMSETTYMCTSCIYTSPDSSQSKMFHYTVTFSLLDFEFFPSSFSGDHPGQSDGNLLTEVSD